MSTPNLSQFIRLGVNANALKGHSPLNTMVEKYRKQVIFDSQVREFRKGEVVFPEGRETGKILYLLRGKLSFKTGLLSKKVLDATKEECLFDINPLLAPGVAVSAVEDGHLLVVDSSLMDTALAWNEAADMELAQGIKQAVPIEDAKLAMAASVQDEEEVDWMSGLLESPLFFNLPPANISRVFSLFERVEVKAGETIIRQGDEGDYFYVLIEGKARVVFDNQPDRAPIDLATAAYFGEDALVSDAPRSASVVMATDGVVGRLDRENFQSLLKDPVLRFVTPDQVGEQLLAHGSKCVLVDVRSREEFDHAPSPNTRNIPFKELRTVIPSLDAEGIYFISEEGGKRSELAGHLFSQANLSAYVIRSAEPAAPAAAG